MQTLTKWATGRNVVLLLLLFLLFNLVLIPPLYPKFQTLDTLSSYTPSEAYKLMDSYGPAGRQQYLVTELTLDLIYPVSTAMLFCLLILYAFRKGFPQQMAWTQWLALIPIVELAADFTENASVVGMLSAYPRQLTWVAQVANLATGVKLALTLPELVFVVGLIGWAVRAIRQVTLRKAHST